MNTDFRKSRTRERHCYTIQSSCLFLSTRIRECNFSKKAHSHWIAKRGISTKHFSKDELRNKMHGNLRTCKKVFIKIVQFFNSNETINPKQICPWKCSCWNKCVTGWKCYCDFLQCNLVTLRAGNDLWFSSMTCIIFQLSVTYFGKIT